MERRTQNHATATAGILLWVLVPAGLLYGVISTAAKVVELFS
jgi:hypothetical protein